MKKRPRGGFRGRGRVAEGQGRSPGGVVLLSSGLVIIDDGSADLGLPSRSTQREA